MSGGGGGGAGVLIQRICLLVYSVSDCNIINSAEGLRAGVIEAGYLKIAPEIVLLLHEDIYFDRH